MQRPADTDHAIQDFFVQRYSPYVFDPERAVSSDDLLALFEAARWAMSSYNAQPWHYVVGDRVASPGRWQQILDCLLDGNRPWAMQAPVLALAWVDLDFAHNGKPNVTAEHDLGAASAFLTVEATTRGIDVHQMAGILPDVVIDSFGLGPRQRPLTALAIGYRGDPAGVEESYAERDKKPRTRRALADVVTGLED